MPNGEIPQEVQVAVEYLLRTAKTHNVVIAGFAVRREDPFILNFGTCSDMGKLELFELLCQMADEKKLVGKAHHIKIGLEQ